jgi:cytochrome b subunit of formate dehydrogenase
MDSYHGKNYRLGFPEKVAGCADCHTAHEVLPAIDPKSSVNPDNIVKTCSKCHSKATPLFTAYYAHGEHNDREKYPILYYTFVFMTSLLFFVFSVFWVHTLLWMFRGFVENREKAAALEEGHGHHVIPDGHKQYRRFNRLHIFLHFIVITSFLGLSLTGLPLKFSDQEWAKMLMTIFGGSANAGLIHRWCAAATFFYFFAAIAMSIHFLFIRKDVPGNWLQRLFGPDSLCPNLRDLQDITGMVRWFLFKGPKPSFERWTYWEKFDFFGVFWGMFIIGGSGLMLWFPQFFGMFLPGWMFNVATILHSDEALLATGFIFTVHFFNTHGRPEKFPMDFVIFNGQLSKHEFIEERGDQWKRYEQLGITETFRMHKTSGVLYDFLFKGFGFAALIIGIALTVLMIYALVAGAH